MSKEWFEETPADPDHLDEGDEFATPRKSSGGKATLTLATLVALGAVAYFKGNHLYQRYWPGSPQSAHATTVIARPAATPQRPAATRPAPKPKSTPQSTIVELPPATDPAPEPVVSQPAPKLQPTTEPAQPTPVVPLDDAPESVSQPASQPAPAAPTATPPAPNLLATLFNALTRTPAPAAPQVQSHPATQPQSPIAAAPADPVAPVAAPAETPDDPRATLLTQLETLRCALEAYKHQHANQSPEFKRYPAWAQLTHRTRDDGTLDPAGPAGPYLPAVPVNPLNGSADLALSPRDPYPGEPLRTTNKLGWVYCPATGNLFATAADGKTVLDESPATEDTAYIGD